MNLVLLFDEDLVGEGRARVGGRRLRHIRRILRAQPGDELCVGLAGERIGRARILALDAERAELELRLDEEPPAALPVVLVLALPRPPVLGRVLAGAASFGVKRIALIHARRVEKTYWSARAMDPASIREKLVLGLEQARDTKLPDLTLHRRFRPFVEDVLPGLLEQHTGYLAHPDASAPCPARLETPCVLAVGPEGGFVESEVERFGEAGLRAVQLGVRALRVETAVPALLSRAIV